MTVLIAGGGIAGMSLALTLHQIGVPFRLFEAVPEIRPLGVGINLQPGAVRELIDLGLEAELDRIGVRTRDYGLYTKTGLHIWTEPRGTWAGYHWPQFSVHRGKLHRLLVDEVGRRAGTDRIECGWTCTGFSQDPGRVRLQLRNRAGEAREVEGALLIGADGIHSAIRSQLVPGERDPAWGGAVLWRGVARARPFKTGASMVMIGHSGLRFVSYPISTTDPATGLADINWIANLQYPPGTPWNREDWSRLARLEDFLPRFVDMRFDWLDVPALVRQTGTVYEYPMVDRDPIDSWTSGRVSLMGDAAHAAYPVGSNGAGAAILDAREIGRAMLDQGVTPQALQAYETKMRPITTRVVLMNRSAGPDQILDVVEERCGGHFERLEDVISHDELATHAARYKAIAGTAVDAVNQAAPTIPPGARVG